MRATEKLQQDFHQGMKRFKRLRSLVTERVETVALKETEKKLMVFDVEGVLLPKKRYLFFEVGRNLKFQDFVRMIFYGLLYELGLISLKAAMKGVFKVFKGFTADEFLRVFRQVPLMPDAKEVLEELRNDGWKTALISSGLPTFVVQDLAKTLSADYAYGFEPKTEEGKLTGDISGDVIERNGKLLVLTKILKLEEVSLKNCVVVADDRNNASLFLSDVRKIGYNPDFVVRIKADSVITGRLKGILAPINNEPRQRGSLPSRNEVIREGIHACGLFVPIFSGIVGLYPVAIFVFMVMLLYFMSELVRMERRNFPIVSFIRQNAASQAELYEFATAPLFFALGILLTLLLFPSPASGAAIVIFALGDSSASIFGGILGRTSIHFNKGKTLEGSIAGFAFAFLGGMFMIGPVNALVGAITAIVVESLPWPVNDNIVTPMVTGATLTFILAWF
jgi:phosphoserine phosphatase/dolichol kinase